MFRTRRDVEEHVANILSKIDNENEVRVYILVHYFQNRYATDLCNDLFIVQLFWSHGFIFDYFYYFSCFLKIFLRKNINIR